MFLKMKFRFNLQVVVELLKFWLYFLNISGYSLICLHVVSDFVLHEIVLCCHFFCLLCGTPLRQGHLTYLSRLSIMCTCVSVDLS